MRVSLLKSSPPPTHRNRDHRRPENWGILSTTGLAPIPYTQQWLTAHIQDAHNILRKPLLVEEFGRSPQIDATGAGREQFFDAVHGTIEAARAQGALGF